MNRRSFFNSIARAAAIIGLAPVIAFRAPKPDWKVIGFWYETSGVSRFYTEEYRKAYEKLFVENQEFVAMCSSRDSGKGGLFDSIY